MTDVKISKNYNIILNTFLKYLPSRFLVILNSLIIVPFLAHILTSKDMGIFQLSIGILNLLCTCSTDWITKSSLRFYEKYKLQNNLEKFYSNIILITVFVYALILISYFIFADTISTKYFIGKDILLLTTFLIIPCGIRQFLYQMLRVLNKPFLYTFSIIIYQFTHLLLFLLLMNVSNNVFAILSSMAIAMLLIDIYIIKEINLKINLQLKFDSILIKESLKYSLPLIITNLSIWNILNINKFTFQRLEMFEYTAMAGIAWIYASYILTPLFSTFLFAVFPLIIKKFELKQKVKNIVTSTTRLYCLLFIPVISTFVYFSKEITNTVFSPNYEQIHIILPFFAVTLFLHELMKIINVKYHLKNRTYIEMLISVGVGIICIAMNIALIPKMNLLGAGISMLTSISLLLLLHSFVYFKSLDYIEPAKIFKTTIITLLIGLVLYPITTFALQFATNTHYEIIQVFTFLIAYYCIIWFTKERILA